MKQVAYKCHMVIFIQIELIDVGNKLYEIQKTKIYINRHIDRLKN